MIQSFIRPSVPSQWKSSIIHRRDDDWAGKLDATERSRSVLLVACAQSKDLSWKTSIGQSPKYINRSKMHSTTKNQVELKGKRTPHRIICRCQSWRLLLSSIKNCQLVGSPYLRDRFFLFAHLNISRNWKVILVLCKPSTFDFTTVWK